MLTEAWVLLPKAMGETCYMVFVAGLISCLPGILLGVGLYVTAPQRLLPNSKIYNACSLVVNVGRSVPFIILMISIVPFTRFITGSTIGTSAAIVPLSISAVPFLARLAEEVFNKIPRGVIEAAQSMGASTYQIIMKVILPESIPGLINILTITQIALVEYSAMAGVLGGGGLGDLAVRYGYQRFDGFMMLITVLILVGLVYCLQFIGNTLIKHYEHSGR